MQEIRPGHPKYEAVAKLIGAEQGLSEQDLLNAACLNGTCGCGSSGCKVQDAVLAERAERDQ